MSLLTLDFETYYSSVYSLKKLTTEEYIRDSRFEVIGVSVQIDSNQPVWFSGTRNETRRWLQQFNWRDSLLLCHNAMFDGAILRWIFGITPHAYLDTLCMARALHGVEVGGSLAVLAERYQIGAKGTAVLDALGKKRLDFSEQELQEYGDYCSNDVSLTYKLFAIMVMGFPDDELKLVDATIRMFTHPMFIVDETLLSERLAAVRAEHSAMLSGLMASLGCATELEVRKKLGSNKQFAEILKAHGAVVPMKLSPRTGKETFALAKKDTGFMALAESKDEYVQELCAVRLGTKSSIEETRIKRFIEVGQRNNGYLPIPLKYYGAHTGRWSGLDLMNFQNLPSRDKKKKVLKYAMRAPEGYVVLNADSAQIEPRVLAWWAGQEDLLAQFAAGEDTYSIFATDIYEKPISKANPIERFVGKTCILGLGYGTGAAKLSDTLETTPPGVKLTLEKCKEIVDLYRKKNDDITTLWSDCDTMIQAMLNHKIKRLTPLGKNGVVWYDNDGIVLPNGLRIRYPNLRKESKDGKDGIVYDSRKGPVWMWGGVVTENVVQALSRIVVATQILAIHEKYKVPLTVHDSAVVVLPDDQAELAKAEITGIMSTPPTWATNLPVACEVSIGNTYGDC